MNYNVIISYNAYYDSSTHTRLTGLQRVSTVYVLYREGFDENKFNAEHLLSMIMTIIAIIIIIVIII